MDRALVDLAFFLLLALLAGLVGIRTRAGADCCGSLGTFNVQREGDVLI